MKHSKALAGLEASILSGITIFTRLQEDYMEKVFDRMDSLLLAKDDWLFHEGDPGDELYVVVAGKMQVLLSPKDAEPFILSELGPGSFFGEMCIIDKAPRSADCRAAEPSLLLRLKSSDFDSILAEDPAAAVLIMDTMLEITASRLLHTGAFLSEMVRWGEAARARAVTDPATGLFNRRFMDESLDATLNRCRVEGKKTVLVMFDMDHFGDINRKYGLPVGDKVIAEGVKAFRSVFAPTDILIRYGGDEFSFLLPDSGAERAQERCDALCAAFRGIRLEDPAELRLTCSMGYAVFPDHAGSVKELIAHADHALYLAKEGGRDRASCWSPGAE